MKTATLLAGILLFCFCGGLLIGAAAPQQAVAIDNPNPCTNCNVIVCWGPGTCPPGSGLVPYNRLYGYALLAEPCEWPIAVCSYVQTGCGFPC
ncbi:hypothetical protein KQH82_07875 [bacterium]|nr:hypothetical protein [bacterium]